MRNRLVRKALRWLLRGVAVAAVAALAVVVGYGLYSRSRQPPLAAWHTLVLQHEFSAARDGIEFPQYLQLETLQAEELQQGLYAHPDRVDRYALGRYNPDSPSHLAGATQDYNRSFELAPGGVPARGAALLVHGLTDSPYSMRALAEYFRSRGYAVVALRLPGHGTIPASLGRVRWEDWRAAVRLAARHARVLAGDGPIHAAGYSTGGTLLLLHALEALQDPSLPKLQRLFLLSPALGVTKAAPLTEVVSLAALIPGFEQAAWLDVLPEFDPYKYNSFPVRAALEIYRLVRHVQGVLAEQSDAGALGTLPPITTFQSVVDATVSSRDVVWQLYMKLPPGDHELALFDVNRYEKVEGVLAPAVVAIAPGVERAPPVPFRVILLGNRDASTREVVARVREGGEREYTATATGLEWPPGVVSLGHVALPFRPDDPLYGLDYGRAHRDRFNLGALAVTGEPGALAVPLEKLARLRSNPFFAFVESRIGAAIERDVAAEAVALP